MKIGFKMAPELRICCCGSIAIIAVPNLILTLRLAYRTQINVFLTESARRLVTEHAFAALTGNEVVVRSTDKGWLERHSVPILIAPATANALGAIAAGLTTHMASKLVLASAGSVFIAPAMNKRMWESPAVQRSVKICESYGYVFIWPDAGIEISDMSSSQSSLASVDSIIKTLIVNL